MNGENESHQEMHGAGSRECEDSELESRIFKMWEGWDRGWDEGAEPPPQYVNTCCDREKSADEG